MQIKAQTRVMLRSFMVRKWEISDLRAFELQVGKTFFITIINVNDLV